MHLHMQVCKCITILSLVISISIMQIQKISSKCLAELCNIFSLCVPRRSQLETDNDHLKILGVNQKPNVDYSPFDQCHICHLYYASITLIKLSWNHKVKLGHNKTLREQPKVFVKTLIRFKALFTHNIFPHDIVIMQEKYIAIKRYCNKKILQ